MRFISLVLLVAILVTGCAAPATQTAAPQAEVQPTAEPTAEPVQPTEAPVVYEPITLKVNLSKLTSYAPIFIAQSEGYFDKFGITLESIQLNKNSDAFPLVISGDLDVYFGPVNAALFSTTAQEPNIKVVADRGYSGGDQCAYTAIVVRKDLFESGEITKPEDLKGVDVNVNPVSVTGWLLDQYMGTAGLSIDDVNPINIPTASYIDAFANKEAAVIVSPEMHVSRLLGAGNATILASTSDFGVQQQAVVVFGKNIMVDHPDWGARFMAAYMMGVKKLAEGKTDANIAAIAEASGEDPQLIKDSCWVAIHPDAMIDFAASDILQQWYVKRGLLDAPVTEDQYWTSKFIEEGSKLIGN